MWTKHDIADLVVFEVTRLRHHDNVGPGHSRGLAHGFRLLGARGRQSRRVPR